jgi:hypothetical protein
MAGAGYKLFATGDVLTAAQVNTYLNEQTVMVFADSAARTTALSGVLAEGRMSYLQDTNAVEVYNGTAWVGVSGAGDVTEVQAGTGISVASGTGPIPVVTNTMATAIDAEGDLIIGDAADAFQRLAIGSNTHVLTVDTSVDGKIKWAAPAGGGKVLQVVAATFTGIKSSASSSYADTDLTATITPSAATSKVLVIASHQSCGKNADASGTILQIKLMRGATEISNSGDAVGQSANTTANIIGTVALTELDSPNTTSATTYKTQYRSVNNTSAALIGNNVSANVAKHSIILMEIGA